MRERGAAGGEEREGGERGRGAGHRAQTIARRAAAATPAAVLLAAGLAAAGLGCSTAEIYPLADPDLAVVATWGSAQSEQSWNGAPLNADAADLPASGARLACHPTGCFLGLSAPRTIEGPGLAGEVSDAVLAFDGTDFEAGVSSSDASWDFTLDALAAAPDGARFALAGRFTGVAKSPFGSGPDFLAKDGAVVMTGDTQAGISDAVWLVRSTTFAPWKAECCENPAVRPVIGGLALFGADRVEGAARYRDELDIIDDTLSSGAPAPTYTGLCHGINDNGEFRWGLFFDVDISAKARTAADCRLVDTVPQKKAANVSFEPLAAAGAGNALVYAGQYTNANKDGVVLSFLAPPGAAEKPLAVTPAGKFAPFVARVTLGTSVPVTLSLAAGLRLPGAFEAVALHEDGAFVACGTVTGAPFGDVPDSCKGLAPGSWLVAYGGSSLSGCVPLDIAGRCRAAAATEKGFVLAGLSADGNAATLVELDASRKVVRRLDRPGIVVDALGVLGGDVIAAGSFTGTLDKNDPHGGTSDWDLFAARWITP